MEVTSKIGTSCKIAVRISMSANYINCHMVVHVLYAVFALMTHLTEMTHDMFLFFNLYVSDQKMDRTNRFSGLTLFF